MVDQTARDMAADAHSKVNAHIAACEVHYETFKDEFKNNRDSHAAMYGKFDEINRSSWKRWLWLTGILLAAMASLALFLAGEISGAYRTELFIEEQMAGHMTAQRLARILGQMPRGTIVMLGPADKMYFGMSTQQLAGHVDFQTEEATMHPGTLQVTNDGGMVAVEDHSGEIAE